MLGSVLLGGMLSAITTLVGGWFILCAGRRWPLWAEEDIRPIGGPAIVAGVVVGVSPIIVLLNPFLLLGAAVIVLVGLIDDRVDLAPWQKLLGQGVAAAMVMIAFPSIRALFLGSTVHLGAAAGMVPFLWTLGLVNGVNLIDGLDGLVIAILFAPIVSLILLGLSVGNPLGAAFAAASLGVLIGFYPYNRHRGRLLLGDTGAELLGYQLAVLTLMILNRGTAGWGILPALFLAALPVSDTVFAVVRRLVHRRSIFQGDKQHIHHRLALRFGTKKAVTILAMVSFVLSCGALLLWWTGG